MIEGSVAGNTAFKSRFLFGRCFLCTETFPSNAAIREHQLAVHELRREAICALCGKAGLRIRIHESCWIRIGFRNTDPDPDTGTGTQVQVLICTLLKVKLVKKPVKTSSKINNVLIP